MRGDLPQRRHTYSDATRFMVYVLWLHGSTQSAIASVVGLRKKQVAGIVDRSEYGNRAALSVSERNRFLAELAAIREDAATKKLIDNGRLPSIVFVAKPLARQQA